MKISLNYVPELLVILARLDLVSRTYFFGYSFSLCLKMRMFVRLVQFSRGIFKFDTEALQKVKDGGQSAAAKKDGSQSAAAKKDGGQSAAAKKKKQEATALLKIVIRFGIYFLVFICLSIFFY